MAAFLLDIVKLLFYFNYRLSERWEETFFLFLFHLRTVRTSKFSASGLWRRTDRCLMPWRLETLYVLALAGTFWGFQVFGSRQAVCPKSYVSGRKLRISNSSPESQKKEKCLRLAVFWIYFTCLPGSLKPPKGACQCQNIRHRSVSRHCPEAENLEFLTVRKRNRKRKKFLRPASG